MSTPVQQTSSNFNLILYILSTYYNLGRKSINIQRHLPNCSKPKIIATSSSGRRKKRLFLRDEQIATGKEYHTHARISGTEYHESRRSHRR